jgi:preprotein translocase subunit YajC
MESLGGLLFPLLILLLFIPIFLSGRKQRRQMQNMQQLQSSLHVGDVVNTTSGLRGTVVDAQYEDTVDLEIADGVITTWLRAAVREKVLDAGTPEPADEAVPGTDGASLDDPVGSPSAVRPDPVRPDPVRPDPVRTDSAPEPVVDTPRDANGSSRP